MVAELPSRRTRKGSDVGPGAARLSGAAVEVPLRLPEGSKSALANRHVASAILERLSAEVASPNEYSATGHSLEGLHWTGRAPATAEQGLRGPTAPLLFFHLAQALFVLTKRAAELDDLTPSRRTPSELRPLHGGEEREDDHRRRHWIENRDHHGKES